MEPRFLLVKQNYYYIEAKQKIYRILTFEESSLEFEWESHS